MSEDMVDLLSDETVIQEETRYTVEEVASMTAVSVTLVQRLVSLNVIETEQNQLHAREVTRLTQILRLRRDLGMNWVGAGMVLDMSQEISRLKARLQAFESHQSTKY